MLGAAGFLGGVAHGFLYPSFSVLVVDLVPTEHRGKMIGLFSSLIGVGATLGAMLLGVLAEARGYPPIYGVAVVATLIAFGVFLLWGQSPESEASGRIVPVPVPVPVPGA